MPRKFITDREIAFINAINREVIQAVTGQEINYYAISLELTKTNELYGEAPRKTWASPVKVNALVHWENPQSVSSAQGIDSKYGADVFFHTQELQDRNVSPKEGDFVEFGQVFFEITSVTQPRLVGGQVNNKILTKCSCVASREGQFAAGGRSSEGVDNSHPVQQSIGVNK